jgi:hypothetical protein
MSIAQNYPNLKPSLLLDFANTEQLDPRITFTRASTATYYGTQTAKAEENLLLRSQEFDNASWAKTGATVLADSTTAPDGTSTADTLTETATTETHRTNQSFVTIAGSTYVFSFFAKKGTGAAARDFVQALLSTTPFGSGSEVIFNIATGAVTQSTGVVSSSITDVGNGWYRCVVIDTATTAASASLFIAGVTSGTEVGLQTYAGNADANIFLWGAQVEQRSTVTAYTPTTTQPITNYTPVLQTAAAGVARFDHNPTTFESLGLLIEEQRANLFLRSEEFDNASWVKTALNLTANTIVAPDGTLTGDKINDTAISNIHFVKQDISMTSGVSYTGSVYAKQGERRYLILRYLSGGAFSTNYICLFDLQTGTATNSPTLPVAGFSITPVGNGWYRCSITQAANATGTGGFSLFLSVDGVNTSYTGDGYSGIYIWGAQLEAGAFPTSYIPTVASQVTRSADAASMTGANFSSWYNQAAGTLYADYVVNGLNTGAANAAYGISDGTIANHITGRTTESGVTGIINFQVRVGGVNQAALNSVTVAVGAVAKNAAAYAVNDFAFLGNAGAVQTDTVGTLPIVTQMQIGTLLGSTNVLNGTIKKIAYYPARCTNAQLQGLTS